MSKRSGFTLLELIIVIIIIGILATLGFTQYTKLVEKGRIAEARAILGTIRSAQQAYTLEYGAYTADITLLAIAAPTACTVTHYFRYSLDATSGFATRCIAGGGGKSPAGPSAYQVTLPYGTGVFTGDTAGYY